MPALAERGPSTPVQAMRSIAAGGMPRRTKSSRVAAATGVDTMLTTAGLLPTDLVAKMLIDRVVGPLRAADCDAEAISSSLAVFNDLQHIAAGIDNIRAPSTTQEGSDGDMVELSSAFWSCFKTDSGTLTITVKRVEKRVDSTMLEMLFTSRGITTVLAKRKSTDGTMPTAGMVRDSIEAAAIRCIRVLFETLYSKGLMSQWLRAHQQSTANKEKLKAKQAKTEFSVAHAKMGEWIRKQRTAFVALCLESATEALVEEDIKVPETERRLFANNKDCHRKQFAAIEALFSLLRHESHLLAEHATGQNGHAFDNAFFIRIVKQLLMYGGKEMSSLVRHELLHRIDAFVDIRYYVYSAVSKLLKDGLGVSSISKATLERSSSVSGAKYRIPPSHVPVLVTNAINLLLRVSQLKTTDGDKHNQESKLNIKGKKNKLTANGVKRKAAEMSLDLDDDDDVPQFDLDSIKLPSTDSNIANAMKPTVEGILFVEQVSKNDSKSDGRRKLHPALIADNHRKMYGECWTELLRLPLTPSLHRQVLVVLHERIVPFVRQPEMFISFLSESYDAGGVSSLLALNGLYQLMTQCNLDYPKFWMQLYALLVPDVFQVKYRERFIELLDVFMSSAHLPSALVASFLKRLARLLLRSPLDVQRLVLPLILSVIKRHPATVVTIHRASSEQQDGDSVATTGFADPFDDTEPDPMLSGAIGSSLWELDVLRQQHFSKDVLQVFELINNKSVFRI